MKHLRSLCFGAAMGCFLAATGVTVTGHSHAAWPIMMLGLLCIIAEMSIDIYMLQRRAQAALDSEIEMRAAWEAMIRYLRAETGAPPEDRWQEVIARAGIAAAAVRERLEMARKAKFDA